MSTSPHDPPGRTVEELIQATEHQDAPRAPRPAVSYGFAAVALALLAATIGLLLSL